MRHAIPDQREPATGVPHVAAVLLAGAATPGSAGVAVAVGVVQAGLVGGWLATVGVPGQTGTLLAGAAAICLAVGVVADVVLTHRHQPRVSGLVGVLAVAFVAVVAQQLLRRGERREVVPAMAGVVALAVLVAAYGALIVLHRIPVGGELFRAAVLAAGAGLVVSHLVDAVLPVPAFAAGVPRGGLGLVLGVAAATAVAVWRLSGTASVGRPGAALLGVCVGLVVGVVGIGSAFAGISSTQRVLPWVARPVVQVGVPLALAAPVAYVIGQIVGS